MNSTTNVEDNIDQSESYSELLKVIRSAYSGKDEIVSMDIFRHALGIDYPHTFEKNQAGDAHAFCSWLHQVFTQYGNNQEELGEIVKETFEIEYLRFIFNNELSHDDEGKLLLLIDLKIKLYSK